LPFTLSHIAAALPVHRPLSRLHLFTPAVIGTMVPDFHLLLPDAPDRLQTHSYWPGLLIFSLPMGLICFALTLLLIKPALIEVVPDGPYVRLQSLQRSVVAGLPYWLLVAGAILAGAVSHLIWDGFTHENAAGVRMFPLLDSYAPELNGHSLQLYRWAQYASSVGGLGVVLAGTALWLWHSPKPTRRPLRALLPAERSCWLALYVLLPVLAIGLKYWQVHLTVPTLGSKLELIGVTGMRASAFTLVAVSLLVRTRVAVGRRGRPC
jgi:hypothetical protein